MMHLIQKTPCAPVFVGYKVNISNSKEFEMANFIPAGTRTMEPRPGVRYATTYTQLTAVQRQLVRLHVHQIIQQLCETALALADPCLEQPLRGFPRTGTQPNYTALDILADMQSQLESGKDIPSGMLGRWNRLFEAWPDVCIEFVATAALPAAPGNTFRSIYA